MNRSATPEGEDLREKQRYVQGYLQVVSNLYGRGNFSQEQARLAERAWKQRLPPSSFVSLIRRHDPAYPRTDEFRVRMGHARQAWERIRPGRPMPHEFSSNYVHSGLTRTQLISRVEYGMKKNPALPPPVVANHYRRLRSLLNDSFLKHTGEHPHASLHDFIFSPTIKDADIDNGIHDLFGGKKNFEFVKNTPSIPTLPGLDAGAGR